MSANTLPRDLLVAPWEVKDPGSAGTLDPKDNGRAIFKIVTAAAEARTLVAPAKNGQEVHLCLDTDGGTCTVTITDGVSGLSTVALDDAGDLVILEAISVGGSLKWQMKGGTLRGAVLTTQLTSVTIADAAGTPDYALQAVINTNAYGFASAAEAITFLYVVQNLQARVAELEARLIAAGLLASA